MSLRQRVVTGGIVITLVLLVADFALASTFRGYLLGRVDSQLAQITERFVEFATRPDRPRPRPGGAADLFGGAPLSEYFVGIARRDGALVGRLDLPLRADRPPPVPDPEAVLGALARRGDALRPFTASAPEGHAWRLVAFQPVVGGEIVLIGASLADVDATYGRMVGVLVLATLALLATLAGVGWWVLRQGVRPLAAMAATAGVIAEGSLDQRVEEADDRTEAGQLGVALNRMLERIEQAFRDRELSEARLRRFVADASHELRTPLTSIRGYAELYRAGALSDPQALSGAMRRVEQEAERMGALVDDLLLLARLDQGRPLDRVPVDLGILAADAVADLRAVDPERPVELSAAAVTVEGDEARLRQAIGNLLVNARTHTPPGTPVRVVVAAHGGQAVLQVADEGPGMTPEVADRVFERFYRADPSRARSGTGDGAGLGLAIVAAVIAAHGGRITLDTGPGRGAVFRVVLPLGDSQDSHSAT